MLDLPIGVITEKRRGGPSVLSLLAKDIITAKVDSYIRSEIDSNDVNSRIGYVIFRNGSPLMAIHSGNENSHAVNALEKIDDDAAELDCLLTVHRNVDVDLLLQTFPNSLLNLDLNLDEEKNSVIYGTTDGSVILYDFNENKEKLKIGDERTPVLTMCIDNGETIIALGNAKGRVIMISLEDYSLVRDFRAAHGPVWALALKNDTTMLYVGGLDDFINQWDLVTYPQPVIVPPGPARRFNPSLAMTNGEKQFARKCSVCHTLEPDGKRRAGPTLYKVFGRMAGTLEGYKFSQALIDSTIVWNEQTIHQLFTEGPDVVLPGTKMPIQRMKSSKDRVDLIKFLKEATE